jgi:hypothetical protein
MSIINRDMKVRDVPDNWAKVDGEWHHIPDEHFITIEVKETPWAKHGDRVDWRMEHSLPCRIRGMKDCPVQEVWEDHLEQDGHWPASARYRIWIEGDFKRTPVEYAHGIEEQIEDERTVHWELMP